MVSIREHLDSVWSGLHQASITDELSIIEYISVLLFQQMGISDIAGSDEERPRRPTIRYGIVEEALKEELRAASKQAGGCGRLFDPHVLFHSSRIRGKEPGNYPIPRHIIAFMLQLLDIGDGHSFADLTCASGGIPVEVMRHYPTSYRRIVGVELVPGWARIARANLKLQDPHFHRAEIYTGNSFHVCAPGGKLGGERFDRIAMAPPFGIPIDPSTAKEALVDVLPDEMRKSNTGYSSEVLFTYLALDHLQPEGRGVVMVPLGLLHKEQRSSILLRQHLVSSHQLRAVIGLAGGALAPFSDEASYLLHLDKSGRVVAPWFFKIERDGYSSERSRDLTTPPEQNPDRNDMLFARQVLALTSQAVQAHNNYRTQELVVRVIVGPREQPYGLVIGVQGAATISAIELYQILDGEHKGSYLLIEAERDGGRATYLAITLPREDAQQYIMQPVTNKRAWAKSLYPDQRGAAAAGTRIFAEGETGQLIAITREGRLLGTTSRWETIVNEGYNLQPEVYVPTRESVAPENAARLLNQVRRDQREVARLVDNLLGNLEIQQRIGKMLPPVPTRFDDFALEGFLGPKQAEIYEKIRALIRGASGYAVYFTPEQLEVSDIVRVRQTLHLLEVLGLIVRVQIKGQGENASGYQYYRVVTELDVLEKIEE
jgi:hypothetical protein